MTFEYSPQVIDKLKQAKLAEFDYIQRHTHQSENKEVTRSSKPESKNQDSKRRH